MSATPHQQKARHNSLKGLPQFNTEQFGQGKHQWAPTSCNNTAIANVEEPLDVEEIIDVKELINTKGKELDKGGVDVDGSELAGEMENALALSEDEPSPKEALSGEEWVAWIDAIEAELAQIEKVKAWTPIILPHNANIIPCWYIFHQKCNEMGHAVCHKARLMVKDFKQQFGVDYIDTFTPPSAKLPPDLKGKPNVATQWFISVYGSKQGACDWYAEVKNFFTELGYSISAADEAVFYKIEDDKFTIVTTAINDFSIITDSAESTNLLIHKQLTKHF